MILVVNNFNLLQVIVDKIVFLRHLKTDLLF